MSLPWRNFTQACTAIQLLTASKLTTAEIGQLYNIAYREIVESHEWSARKGEALISTVDPYSDGTVAIATGGTTVTGTGTTFTSGMVGRAIRIGSQPVLYTVDTFTSGTSLEIDVAWPFDAETEATYEIFQYVYDVDDAVGSVSVGQILLPSEQWSITERSLYWITQRDPLRTQTGGSARAYILHGVNSSGHQLIEFWPRFAAATSVRIPYYKRVDDLSGSDQPIIRGDVVEALATSYCFSTMFAKFGAPEYAQAEDRWEKRFEARQDAALVEDLERHGTPRSVQDYRRVPLDWDFQTRNDV